MAEQFTGLPMSDLIGAPLLAAAEANNMMAVTQTRFLLDTAFAIQSTGEGDEKVDTYSPIIIDMKLTRGVLIPADPDVADSKPSIDQVTTTFSLPLLTILPLNSLAVDNVDITFDMEVKSSYSEASNETTEDKMAASSTFSAKVGFGMFSASVTGSVSYDSARATSHDTHYEKSNSAKYGVRVHAGQLPLPQGVTTIIQAFTNSITPITMPSDPSSA
ncbi:DUF2589 domain-containing protein [Nannocystis bainbridge]|uniref:DUF2589 domain-containing protein n=1 Tax=Nannocystis bainbridge TaxID=2995303 RepID=A0ABT5DT73_9BACT|nr:DUF2589 domain-containing protein [Nannocystis bainbridge]MDC0716820.1 DUF2589 domain-containing protein [Nannocystis bainbridge]